MISYQKRKLYEYRGGNQVDCLPPVSNGVYICFCVESQDFLKSLISFEHNLTTSHKLFRGCAACWNNEKVVVAMKSRFFGRNVETFEIKHFTCDAISGSAYIQVFTYIISYDSTHPWLRLPSPMQKTPYLESISNDSYAIQPNYVGHRAKQRSTFLILHRLEEGLASMQ